MKLVGMILAVIGLVADIITIVSFSGYRGGSIPGALPPFDIDTAYFILFMTTILYIAGWFFIYEKYDLRFGDEATAAIAGIAYFIPLALLTYFGVRMFGRPHAQLLQFPYGMLADVLLPK